MMVNCTLAGGSEVSSRSITFCRARLATLRPSPHASSSRDGRSAKQIMAGNEKATRDGRSSSAWGIPWSNMSRRTVQLAEPQRRQLVAGRRPGIPVHVTPAGEAFAAELVHRIGRRGEGLETRSPFLHQATPAALERLAAGRQLLLLALVQPLDLALVGVLKFAGSGFRLLIRLRLPGLALLGGGPSLPLQFFRGFLEPRFALGRDLLPPLFQTFLGLPQIQFQLPFERQPPVVRLDRGELGGQIQGLVGVGHALPELRELVQRLPDDRRPDRDVDNAGDAQRHRAADDGPRPGHGLHPSQVVARQEHGDPGEDQDREQPTAGQEVGGVVVAKAVQRGLRGGPLLARNPRGDSRGCRPPGRRPVGGPLAGSAGGAGPFPFAFPGPAVRPAAAALCPGNRAAAEPFRAPPGRVDAAAGRLPSRTPPALPRGRVPLAAVFPGSGGHAAGPRLQSSLRTRAPPAPALRCARLAVRGGPAGSASRCGFVPRRTGCSSWRPGLRSWSGSRSPSEPAPRPAEPDSRSVRVVAGC